MKNLDMKFQRRKTDLYYADYYRHTDILWSYGLCLCCLSTRDSVFTDTHTGGCSREPLYHLKNKLHLTTKKEKRLLSIYMSNFQHLKYKTFLTSYCLKTITTLKQIIIFVILING